MSQRERQYKARPRHISDSRVTFDRDLEMAKASRSNVNIGLTQGVFNDLPQYVSGIVEAVDKYFVKISGEWFNKGHIVRCKITSAGEPRDSTRRVET